VEVKVGIRHVSKEIVVDSRLSADDVKAALTKAFADPSGVFALADSHGRQVLIPVSGVGYVELGTEHARPVGFGTI
jgi:3-hydroxyacyl-CoA dehydrogenase